MTFKVTYIEPAERDIERAFRWFAERSSTVGDRFLLRIAEVEELDVVIENGSVTGYRSKINVSFKYEDDA